MSDIEAIERMRAAIDDAPTAEDKEAIQLLVDCFDRQQATITTLRAEVERQAELIERLKMEARIHHDEAATANATIAEIYQMVTGSKGEPGNWNGAAPVRALIARADKAEAALAKVTDRLNTAMPFLVGLAAQNLVSEMDEEQLENGDTTDGYEWIVEDARRVLASLTDEGAKG